MQTIKQRSVNLDLIRCLATLFVFCVHYFFHSGFYDTTVSGLAMFLMCLARNCFIICVPLFMLLTGYLMRTKKAEKAYFRKITKTLGIYVLASLLCLAYRLLAYPAEYSLPLGLYGIFSFQTAPYAWYIEMYIGLFFLIPFLNVLYNNLSSQRHKQWLLLVMFCTTALPSVVNIYRFFDLPWWLDPASSGNFYWIIPDWWVNIYPLTYYFIGCYLSEYPLKLKKRTNLLAILLTVLVYGAFCFYRSHGAVYQGGVWQEYYSAFTVILSVLVFNFFLLLDCGKLRESTKKWIARCSDWSLGAYLVSWIFDDLLYPQLCARIPGFLNRLPWFFLIVPAVAIASIAASAALNLVYRFLCKRVFSHFPRQRLTQ